MSKYSSPRGGQDFFVSGVPFFFPLSLVIDEKPIQSKREQSHASYL